MKMLLIFAAVLLCAVTAQVPPMSEVVHKVTVPIPMPNSNQKPHMEEKAHVVEVPKLLIRNMRAALEEIKKPGLVLVPMEAEVTRVAGSPISGTTTSMEVPKVPMVPNVQVPKVPAVPNVDIPIPPMIENVEAPQVPVAPNVEIPKVPAVPSVEIPKEPMVPIVEVPVVPVVPKVEEPVIPKIPSVEIPKVPEVPKTPAEAPKVRTMAIVVDPTRVEMQCHLECTKLEFMPICATNGDCRHEFPNQCVMDVFTCQHPQLGFKATNDDSCQMHWLKRCTEQDLMG